MPTWLRRFLWTFVILLGIGIMVSGNLAATELIIFTVLAIVGGVIWMVYGGKK
jgi:hypothetical protein